ncbi:hypothetical protein [Rugosimonospora africana]|nr:hypothetical protein [Rugosimonospora africana]
MHPLVEEAMKKAAVAWLTVPGQPGPYAVWCLWLDGALYVVSGPGEQPAPGLAGAVVVDVSSRGDHGGRIVTWPAQVQRLAPDDEAWPPVTQQLAGKRLNAPASTADTVRRWADECVINRLVPVSDQVEAGAPADAGSGAAPPRSTPAANRTAKPFRLHRVRGAGPNR